MAGGTCLALGMQAGVLVLPQQQVLACFGAHGSKMKPLACIQLAAGKPVRSLICLTSDSCHLTNIASFCELIKCYHFAEQGSPLSQGPTVFDNEFWLSPSFSLSDVTKFFVYTEQCESQILTCFAG